MPIIEPFEQYADRYDSWFEDNRFAYLSELRAVGALIPPEGEGLEVGVGTGRFASKLGIKAGVEPSEKMAEIARGRGIEVTIGAAEELPFRDGSFDYVLMVTVICFLDDLDGALREAYRVISEGGSIIIAFIDRESLLGGLYSKEPRSTFFKEASFYSVDEVVEHLERAGFGNLAFKQTIFRMPEEIKDIEDTKDGYGEGSFVVVKGNKSVPS